MEADDYFDEPSYCPDCDCSDEWDGAPIGFDPGCGWRFCPFHGTRLMTMAELDGRAEDAEAEARIGERNFDMVAFAGDICGMRRAG